MTLRPDVLICGEIATVVTFACCHVVMTQCISACSTPLPRVHRIINTLDIIDDPAVGRIPRREL